MAKLNKVLSVILCAVTWQIPLISSQCDLTCENVDDDIAEIVEQMDDLEYNVLSGQFELYDAETSNVYIPFARPDTDYLISVFEDFNSYYRFGGQDAIIWRGCTPPTVTYFGYRSFSAAKITDQDNNTRPTAFTLFRSSLGESINQLVINTESNDDTLFPEPFDRKTNIVTTGDAQTYTDVMNAYITADLLDEMSLNLNAIPDPLFDYSESELDVPRDVIGLIIEIVFDPDSPCDNNLYLNQSFPFRLFYKDTANPREGIDSNNRDSEQNITKCDRDPDSGNEDAFDAAIDDAINYFQEKFGYTFISDTIFDDTNGITVGNNDQVDLNIFEYGEACINNQVDCMYDNRDNYYRWTAEDYTLSDTDFYVIVGLNHNNFASSVLNSLMVSRISNPDSGNIMDGVGVFINYGYERYGFDLISNGVICDNDDPSPCDQAFLENLFVIAVARPINCNVTADGIFPMCFDNDMLPDDDRFIFFAEALLNTRTQTRPTEDCLIPWRLLQFSTTSEPTSYPTTAAPTTAEPTTAAPTTAEPTKRRRKHKKRRRKHHH